MRKFLLGAIAATLATPALAQTPVEINVLTPAVAYNGGLKDLAAAYTKQTGIKVTVKTDGMGKIVSDIKTAPTVADVIVLPLSLMDGLEAEGGIVPGSSSEIGRVTVGLAVAHGKPHPDISTPRKLAAALKAGGTVIYSDPASGSMEARIINDMLHQYPIFQGVKTKISTKGEGGQALIKGEADMALQLACEVLNHPELDLAGLVPVELHAYLDTDIAVSARSTQAEASRAFIAFVLAAEHDGLWKSEGLDRHPPQ
jgi:molybdate transport system substrate-binding protein